MTRKQAVQRGIEALKEKLRELDPDDPDEAEIQSAIRNLEMLKMEINPWESTVGLWISIRRRQC
jgi:FtsZ-binding cell division protein ZapB